MLPGYPHSVSLSSEGHVASPANSDVPVPLSAAISMTSAPNGINGYSGGLPPSITLHNMAVPSSPGFLNGATCKILFKITDSGFILLCDQFLDFHLCCPV